MSTKALVIKGSDKCRPLGSKASFSVSCPILFTGSTVRGCTAKASGCAIVTFGMGTARGIALSPCVTMCLRNILSNDEFGPISGRPLIRAMPAAVSNCCCVLMKVTCTSSAVVLRTRRPVCHGLKNGFRGVKTATSRAVLR